MQPHQQAHLLSSYHAATRHLIEIREMAASGISADGTRYAPFPEPLRTDLLPALDQLIADLDNLVHQLVPASKDHDRQPRGIRAATMWITTLLLLTEEQLDGLNPERMSRQYGTFPRDEQALLKEGVERMQKIIDNLLARLK